MKFSKLPLCQYEYVVSIETFDSVMVCSTSSLRIFLIDKKGRHREAVLGRSITIH